MMGTCVDRTLEFHEVCTFLGAAKRVPLNSKEDSVAAAAEVYSLADFHQVCKSARTSKGAGKPLLDEA